MTNEKDKATTAQILRHYQIECGPVNAIQKDILESSIEKALATVRAAEREAAFRDAVNVVTSKADELRQTEPFGTGVISASVQILEALERAAVATENRKGEG